MKKIFYILFFIALATSAFPQEENINWTFFIDGKIQPENIATGEFICFANKTNQHIIRFNWLIGHLVISKDDLDYMRQHYDSLNTAGNLLVNIHFQKSKKNSLNTYVYSFFSDASLIFNYPYVVFEITNLNKGNFYLWYYSDDMMSIPFKSNKRKFGLKKTSKTTNVFFMQRIFKPL